MKDLSSSATSREKRSRAALGLPWVPPAPTGYQLAASAPSPQADQPSNQSGTTHHDHAHTMGTN